MNEGNGRSAEVFVEVGGEVFVNEGPRGGIKYPDESRPMAKDEAMVADPQPIQAVKFLPQGFHITGGQGGEGGLRPTPRFRS